LRYFVPGAILWAVLYAPVLFGQPSQIERLEAQLKTQPDSADIRVSLVREYFRVSGQDGSAEQSRVTQLLWLIEHHSDIPVLGEPLATIGHFGNSYDAVKTARLDQTEKANVPPQVLANAANFFRPLEPSRSIELLAKARQIDPKNSMWTAALAEIYVFQIVGITGLNQNGLPLNVDPAKSESAEAKKITLMLLASKDAALVDAAGRALDKRGAIGAAMTGRTVETASLAEALLQRAVSLEPQNAEWHGALASFYARRAQFSTGDLRATLVRKAMAEFNAQAAIDAGAMSSDTSYARIAIEAGELDKAKSVAEHCLTEVSRAQFKDGAIHECNLLLGRIALRRGDFKNAGEYLLSAAQVDGKGPLSSFGPNMMLAKELLEKGQRDVVLEYFRRCARFWSFDGGQLKRWTAQVEAGQIPAFGANLVC
jgi:hypothetical protein